LYDPAVESMSNNRNAENSILHGPFEGKAHPVGGRRWPLALGPDESQPFESPIQIRRSITLQPIHPGGITGPSERKWTTYYD
jgi:hypothetical protein